MIKFTQKTEESRILKYLIVPEPGVITFEYNKNGKTKFYTGRVIEKLDDRFTAYVNQHGVRTFLLDKITKIV